MSNTQTLMKVHYLGTGAAEEIAIPDGFVVAYDGLVVNFYRIWGKQYNATSNQRRNHYEYHYQ